MEGDSCGSEYEAMTGNCKYTVMGNQVPYIKKKILDQLRDCQLHELVS
jgi:hypothetical protein